jgi:hypothetical protein
MQSSNQQNGGAAGGLDGMMEQFLSSMLGGEGAPEGGDNAGGPGG